MNRAGRAIGRERMRRVVIIVAVLGAAASCGGQIMSFGTGTGAPGEDVSFSLSIDPD